ncbi:MAG: hypothetical protein KKE50_01600 [Nanoarchaeota archaeon]|nr:hypothetical protein [Nanoarchaeota archaeon]
MKKRVVVFLLLLVSSIFLSGAAYAAESMSTKLPKIMDDFVRFIEPIAANILGDVPGGEWFFAKILLFAMLLAIIWIALDSVALFNENTWALAIVAIGASVLSIRFIANDWIVQTIILPYSVLGVAISAGIPFMIYFVIVNMKMKDSPTIRKFAWIFFAVIFVGLYFSRVDKLGDFAWIYPATAIAAFAVALFDGSISRGLAKISAEKAVTKANSHLIDKLKEEIIEAGNQFAKGAITKKRYDEKMKELNNKIVGLKK